MFGGQNIPKVDGHVKNILKYCGLLLVLLAIWLLISPKDTWLYGVMVGIGVGMFNSITLAKRIKNLPYKKSISSKRSMSFGLSMRFTLIIAVLFLVSQQMPSLNLLSVLIGLLIPIVVSNFLAIGENLKEYYKRENNLSEKYYTD